MMKKNKGYTMLFNFGSNMRKWISKFSNLKPKNTNRAELYFEKTRELRKKGKNKRSLKTINKAIKYDYENVGYQSVKYLILKRLKKYKELVRLFDFFIEFDIDKVSHYFYKSQMIVQELKKYKKAIKVINRGLLIKPYDPRLVELKLEVLIIMQKFGEAKVFFTQVQAYYNHKNDYRLYI